MFNLNQTKKANETIQTNFIKGISNQLLFDEEKNDVHVHKEKVDITQCTLSPEDQEFGVKVDTINIFNIYYRQRWSKKHNQTCFEGIDQKDDKSVNNFMEFVFEEMNKYNKSDIELKDTLFDVDHNLTVAHIDYETVDEMYLLYLDDVPRYASQYLVTIVTYIAELDWANINWSIIRLK